MIFMAKKKTATWVTYEPDEMEALISKMAKEGMTAAQIGLKLRDTYGIPDVRQAGIKVSRIARREAPKAIPEDMYSLLEQAVNLHVHLAKSKKDGKARHAVDTIESKIRRLGKYYVRRKRLPADWKYSLEKAKLLVK